MDVFIKAQDAKARELLPLLVAWTKRQCLFILPDISRQRVALECRGMGRSELILGMIADLKRDPRGVLRDLGIVYPIEPGEYFCPECSTEHTTPYDPPCSYRGEAIGFGSE